MVDEVNISLQYSKSCYQYCAAVEIFTELNFQDLSGGACLLYLSKKYVYVVILINLQNKTSAEMYVVHKNVQKLSIYWKQSLEKLTKDAWHVFSLKFKLLLLISNSDWI